MPNVSIAIFDADGVLLDSLDAHLQICRDQASSMNLKIAIPGPEEFRALVARGAVISPMEEFFHSVGFPRPKARIADDVYRREFAQRYPVFPFARIKEMLAAIAESGVGLGIVTSNSRKNISAALGDAMQFFERRFVFAEDGAQPVDKPQAIVDCVRGYGCPATSAIYIGDQPRDYLAARKAETRFLGVTYGWGIQANDTRFPLAKSPGEIAEFVRVRAADQRSR